MSESFEFFSSISTGCSFSSCLLHISFMLLTAFWFEFFKYCCELVVADIGRVKLAAIASTTVSTLLCDAARLTLPRIFRNRAGVTKSGMEGGGGSIAATIPLSTIAALYLLWYMLLLPMVGVQMSAGSSSNEFNDELGSGAELIRKTSRSTPINELPQSSSESYSVSSNKAFGSLIEYAKL